MLKLQAARRWLTSAASKRWTTSWPLSPRRRMCLGSRNPGGIAEMPRYQTCFGQRFSFWFALKVPSDGWPRYQKCDGLGFSWWCVFKGAKQMVGLPSGFRYQPIFIVFVRHVQDNTGIVSREVPVHSLLVAQYFKHPCLNYCMKMSCTRDPHLFFDWSTKMVSFFHQPNSDEMPPNLGSIQQGVPSIC